MSALLLTAWVLPLIAMFWPVIPAVLVVSALMRGVIEPWQAARSREYRARLRHAEARQEIDAITLRAIRSMHQAANAAHHETIEGAAVEVKR